MVVNITKFILLFIICLVGNLSMAQTIGKTQTEQYKASFETAIDISQFMDYDGKQIPIQILKFPPSTIEHSCSLCFPPERS